jgi:hypothetical protein
MAEGFILSQEEAIPSKAVEHPRRLRTWLCGTRCPPVSS